MCSTEVIDLPVGKELFLFDPQYRNLNHGSFGTYPRAIQNKLREYQEKAEARPDPFNRYDYPKLLDKSREAVAQILHAPTNTVVFVGNATTGVNTVLCNLAWGDDYKDEILHFSTIYSGCGKSVDYFVDTSYGRVSSRSIELQYPIEDDEVVARFRAAVKSAREEGKRPRICVCDVVSALPGVRFPFEAVVAACKELGIASLVDGAQGIGMVHLDLEKVDPDFFVSNCHKWLYVPRGCAVFYVPVRNQHLIRSTVPTSVGYVAKSAATCNPLLPSPKPKFTSNFEFVGTIDCAPYLCVKDSIKWRQETLGGEARIIEYQQKLAKEGGKRAAEILGTEIMENSTGTLTNCGMVNVALPFTIQQDAETGKGDESARPSVHLRDALSLINWLQGALVSDYHTYVALFWHQNRFWVRLSAQVYLSIVDFEWAGETLRDVCKRATKLDYVKPGGGSVRSGI